MTTEKTSPYLFDEFFASGKEEAVSPFLTKEARRWSINLPLKVSVVSAVCLVLAFALRFIHPVSSNAFLLFVYFLSGTPALIGALEDCKNLEINIDVLMTLAALLSALIGSGLEGGLLLVLFELSGSMEMSVMQKTKSTLSNLHKLSPSTGYVVGNDGRLSERSVKEIEVGSEILIKAGEIAPLDGKVVEGFSFVTLSHLTGESVPIAKKPGDEVPAGARNLEGTLTLLVLRSNRDSTLSTIIDLITQAQESKPKVQQWIDRIDKQYATGIIVLTALFAVSIPLLFPTVPFIGIEGSIYRALTFLIAASPCALVIGAPTAYLAALSSVAKRGILLKGGTVLDALASCKSVAFDKTGTLTTGRLGCTLVEPLNEEAKRMPRTAVLSVAGSMERHVKHPIAEAITELVRAQWIAYAPLSEIRSVPGSGLEAVFEGSIPCFLGSRAFIISKAPETEPMLQGVSESSTQTYFLLGDALFAFHFTDQIRKDVKQLLERLRNNLGMEIAMLTGDEEHNAKPIAAALGIHTVRTNLKPEDKLKEVERLSTHQGLIMVGDGVNDAPALARATVGVSMGKIGSASAVAASDVVFLQGDIGSLDKLIETSHRTVRIVKQNLTLAFCVIFLATTPALLGFIPLWLAVVLHEGGTLLVGLNSLRLLKK